MMRKAYKEEEQEGSEGEEIEEETWEEEAEDLYQWTQKLSFADVR